MVRPLLTRGVQKYISHESRPAIRFRTICISIHIIWLNILPENVVCKHGYTVLCVLCYNVFSH